MATRHSSRRSAASDAINPNLISFFNVARLKEELQKRNLPIDGGKDALVERLHDFVCGISPTPQKSTSVKKERLSQVHVGDGENAIPKRARGRAATTDQNSTAPPKKKRKNSEKGKEEPKEVKEEPPDDAPEPSSIIQPPVNEEPNAVEDFDDIIEEEFSIEPVKQSNCEPADEAPLPSPKPVKKKNKRKSKEQLIEANAVIERRRGGRDRQENYAEVVAVHSAFDDEIFDKGDEDVPRKAIQSIGLEPSYESTRKLPKEEAQPLKKILSLEKRHTPLAQKRKESTEGSVKDKAKIVPVTMQFAELMEQKKKKEREEAARKAEEKKKEEAEQRRRLASKEIKKEEGAPGELRTVQADLLENIMGNQQTLLEKKLRTGAELEAEKRKIVSDSRQSIVEKKVKEEMAREEKIRREKEREKEHNRTKIAIPAVLSSVKTELEVEDEIAKEEVAQSPPPPAFEPLDLPPPAFEPIHSIPLPSDQTAESIEIKHQVNIAPKSETPADGIKHLKTLSSLDDLNALKITLEKLRKEREESDEEADEETSISADVNEVLQLLLSRVEKKVEKELRWERAAKRAVPVEEPPSDAVDGETYPPREHEVTAMRRDPRAFLTKAAAILDTINGVPSPKEEERVVEFPSAASLCISQVIAEPGTYDETEEERPLPEFHGEPVPSDDEEALFLEAAGMSKKEKKPRHAVVEEENLPTHEDIELDYYNGDLQIKSEKDKSWVIEPDNAEGLALMWGGVRLNHGVKLPWREGAGKKLVFQIKLVDHMPMKMMPFTEAETFDVRVGFSLRSSPNILGEYPGGWCFCATAKKASSNDFADWGDPLDKGDVLTVVLDISNGSISYYRDEEFMGTAFEAIPLPDGEAIYPHICVKNYRVAVNFGDFPEVEGGWSDLKKNEDWIFPKEIPRPQLESSKLAPEEKAACTLLMMVGLPGVGKTTWVRQYIRDHPEETWNVINAEGVMAAMKVNGVPRARVHTGRWDAVLGLVAKAINKLTLLAARRRRNYILDISNVSRDKRKYKLINFKDFCKKCVVIVADEDEMASRQRQQSRQDGTAMVPPEAMLELKAVFTLPSEDVEDITHVHYVEPPIDRIAEAIEIVSKFNEEGRPWFQKRYRGRGGRGRGRGGYMGFGDRRPSGKSPVRGGRILAADYGRPLSINTSGLNGSGPPSSAGTMRRSVDSPAFGGHTRSPLTGPASNINWATRRV